MESAALATSLPMSGGRSLTVFTAVGRQQVPLSQQPLASWVAVSPGNFLTLGIPVVRGRAFERQDAVGLPGAVVINEATAPP